MEIFDTKSDDYQFFTIQRQLAKVQVPEATDEYVNEFRYILKPQGLVHNKVPSIHRIMW